MRGESDNIIDVERKEVNAQQKTVYSVVLLVEKKVWCYGNEGLH